MVDKTCTAYVCVRVYRSLCLRVFVQTSFVSVHLHFVVYFSVPVLSPPTNPRRCVGHSQHVWAVLFECVSLLWVKALWNRIHEFTGTMKKDSFIFPSMEHLPFHAMPSLTCVAWLCCCQDAGAVLSLCVCSLFSPRAKRDGTSLRVEQINSRE